MEEGFTFLQPFVSLLFSGDTQAFTATLVGPSNGSSPSVSCEWATVLLGSGCWDRPDPNKPCL